MPNELDVYQVLKSFAKRNKISAIDFRVFVLAVQRQARTYDQDNLFFRDLALHPEGVLVPRLLQLAHEKRIAIMSVGNQIDRIYLPEAFTEPVYAEYRRMEDNPEVPFPDEDNLKLSIPSEWIQPVSVENDLPSLIEMEGDRPVLLYRITFPEGLKSIVTLSISASEKLLEYAALKIRHYLRKGSNKDYIQQRMMGAFTGKESLLKDALTTAMIKPFDAVQEMRHGRSDFTYPFWAYLSSAVKKDLSGKGDLTVDDVAVLQSAYIVDVYNNFYKGRSQREQDRENAFKTMAQLIRKPPYLFSIQDLVDFRDGQSRPLLGKYTRQELEEWIHTQTTRAAEGLMPEILVLPTGKGRSHLIAKDRFLPYLVKALHDARSIIKPLIIREWQNVLYDFRVIDAMENDSAFRANLHERIEGLSSALGAALDSRFAISVYAETRGSKDTPADLDRYFGGGIAPIDILLDLDRKRLLTDVRMLLPFWYTVPVLSWFIGLFKRARRRKSTQREAVKSAIAIDTKGDSAQGGNATTKTNSRAMEFSQMASKAERRFLPDGYAADEYLAILESRWNNMLDPRAKLNLTEDVNSLVRDYLRGILRTMKPSSFTPERIETMASNLADTSNLIRIRNHSSLEEYIRLYMVKILKR
ncbi:MAG: hypothetical protein E4H20_05065 [Spirochaetales bacterium]|nr:MAG: hypothetical protein E4H20_05065 [Spirochaetales bacterium]